MSHTGARPMTPFSSRKLCPLVCVAAETKKQGEKLVGDKFAAPLTNCAFITRHCS